MNKRFVFSTFLLLTGLFVAGCGSNAGKPADNVNSNAASSNPVQSNTSNSVSEMPETVKGDGNFVASETGTEKAKPAAGKANVQGRVLYNGQPQSGIEVKLCETFSRFYGGCGGENFVTKTDASGEYLLAGITPKVYQGLLVKVFNSKNYVFATQSFGITSAEYKFDADKTFFAPATNLFKDDLKLLNPKANAKVAAADFGIKWEAYPDASYYKLTLSPEEYDVNSSIAEDRLETTEYKVNQALKPGNYTLRLEAYNANDIKLAELANDVAFTVIGESASK